MKKTIALLFCMLSGGAFAAIDDPKSIDFTSQTQPALQVYQASEKSYLWTVRNAGQILDLSGYAPFMYWATSNTAQAVVTASVEVVNATAGTFRATFSPASLNYAGGIRGAIYAVGVTSNNITIARQGGFTIIADPYAAGVSPIDYSTNVNWANYNWVGLPEWTLLSTFTAATQSLWAAIGSASGAGWSGSPATQDVNFAQYYATNIGGIDFDTTPSGSPQPARMQWNADRSTLDLGINGNADRSTLDLGINENINLDVGQQLMLFAKSIETNTINKGEVVFVAGASGDNPTIKRASNASEPLSARTIGIAAETIASNNNGIVVTAGTVYNINTTNFTQGANLYLGANGTLQTNLPTAPLHGVFIGVVERVGENNGQIFVHVQNYQEIEELSDVNVRNRQADDLLLWNGTVWTNYAKTNIVTTETDPIWTSASNLYYLASNPSNFLTSYTETDPVWSAASTGYYTKAEITDILNTSVIVAVESDPIFTNWLATATVVSVESDPIWSSASNLYATTAGVAAAYLPLAGGTMGGNLDMGDNAITNVPIISYPGRAIELETGLIDGSGWYFSQQPTILGYLTSTGAAATYLSLAGGTISGNIDMGFGVIEGSFGGDIDFGSGSFSGTWDFNNQPIIPGYLTSTGAAATYLTKTGGTVTASLTVNGPIVTTNTIGSGFNTINFSVPQFNGVWTFTNKPNIAGYLTTTGATATYLTQASAASTYLTSTGAAANYLSITGAAATYINSTNLAGLIVTTNNLSNIKGSGLGVVSNKLVVTGLVANASGWSGYAATQDVSFASNGLTSVDYVQFVNATTSATPNVAAAMWVSNNVPQYIDTGSTVRAFYTTANFSPATYVTVASANTNYWRITTPPVSNSSFGLYGQAAIDGTNMYFYNHLSNKWLKVNGVLEW
jgi:hypothetical protein